MQSLILLINLLRAVLSAHHDGAPLVLLPPADLLKAVLGEQSPEHLNSAIMELLQSADQTLAPVTQLIPRVYRLAHELERVDGGDSMRVLRFQAYGQALLTIATLNEAVTREHTTLRHINLHLKRSGLVDLLQEWHIGASGGGPNVLVVCQARSTSADYTAKLRGRHFLQRRVAVTYQAARPQPRLRLRALSVVPEEPEPSLRLEWLQHPTPDYDLDLLTEQERYKGHIQTRLIQMPLVVGGDQLTLTLASEAGSELLVTDIFDENGDPLTRVIRWPPTDAALV